MQRSEDQPVGTFQGTLEPHQPIGQQLDPALRGMSVALLDRKGVCKGAIGATTPAASVTQQQLIDKLLPLLREAAEALKPLL